MMETEEQVTMRFTVFLKVELQKKKKKKSTRHAQR